MRGSCLDLTVADVTPCLRAINPPRDNGDIISRQGRNDNLLTSHVMRRVILHPPTRSATSPPFRGRIYSSRSCHSRNCHLSSRRFTIPFTPPAIPASPSFERFISARSLVYPRRRQQLRTQRERYLSSSRCATRRALGGGKLSTESYAARDKFASSCVKRRDSETSARRVVAMQRWEEETRVTAPPGAPGRTQQVVAVCFSGITRC